MEDLCDSDEAEEQIEEEIAETNKLVVEEN